MTAELRDTRVLGALRFTDAVTALPIDAPLVVTAPGVRWRRNRRAAWIIAAAFRTSDARITGRRPT